MMQLLKIEWMKVKNYKAFWVFSLLYIVSLFGINYIAWSATANSGDVRVRAFASGPYGFPAVWQTTAWISSWLLYLPGMLFINLYINEFNFKTHRQNIIDGWTRMNFINVKFLFAAVYSVVIALVIGLNGLIFGAASGGDISFAGAEYVFYSFIQTLSYLLFAQFLAIVFRRSGVAIIIFVIFGLVFEWLITALLAFNADFGPASYFLPLQVTDVLVPDTFFDKLIYRDAPGTKALLIGAVGYIGLYYFFAMRKYKNDDL